MFVIGALTTTTCIVADVLSTVGVKYSTPPSVDISIRRPPALDFNVTEPGNCMVCGTLITNAAVLGNVAFNAGPVWLADIIAVLLVEVAAYLEVD